MKPITDINDMPVLNWYKFHESHQSGKPDWKQLYSDLPKNINEKEAQKVYQDLIFQMPSLNINTLYFYMRLLQHTELFANQLYRYRLGFADKPNSRQCEIEFGKYFNSLENDFDGFKFYQYSLKSDYKDLFKKWFKFNIPNEFAKEIEGLSFLHPSQLFDYAKSLNNEVFYKILISEIFISKLVNKKELKLGIRGYHDFLKDFYLKDDRYDDWIELRPTFFNFADTDKIKEGESSYSLPKMYEILFGLEQFASVKIEPKTDSILKLNTYLELANKQAEKQKPNSK